MKFRKRAVVGAQQWFPDRPIPSVVLSPGLDPTSDNPGGVWGHLQTPEGNMTVRPGDWVITNARGEQYPRRDEWFRGTYEGADDEGREALAGG